MIKIYTSSIYITYKDNNDINIAKLFGPLYTYFKYEVPEECTDNDYVMRIIINSEIIKKYSKQYKNIVNIYYENFKIERV